MRDAAQFIASRSASAEAGVLPTILRSIRRAVKVWQARSQLARLADFDDHMLADIGLTRADVRDALDLPFSADPGRELQIRAGHKTSRGWNA